MEQSDYYDEITDAKQRERLKIYNVEIYNYYLEQEKIAHTGHVDYAKWLFASLLAVHGGSIYALSSLRTAVPYNKGDFLIWAAAQNLLAVFLTLVAGLFAWLNLQLLEQYFGALANPTRLYKTSALPKASKWIDRTLYISAGFGIISGILFLTSAMTIILGLIELRPPPPNW